MIAIIAMIAQFEYRDQQQMYQHYEACTKNTCKWGSLSTATNMHRMPSMQFCRSLLWPDASAGLQMHACARGTRALSIVSEVLANLAKVDSSTYQ